MKALFWAMVMAATIFSCGHSVKPYFYIRTAEPAIASVRTYHVWVDKEFGAADRLSIDNAIRQWNYAMNGYVRIEIETYEYDMEIGPIKRAMAGEGWIILKIDQLNPMVEPLDRGNSGKKQYFTLAWVNAIGGNRMFVVRDRMANDWVEGVVMHELGHLLGAEHDDAYLMQPHYNWADYRCVDYEALKRVATFQVIPIGRLNYCEYGDATKLPVSYRP